MDACADDLDRIVGVCFSGPMGMRRCFRIGLLALAATGAGWKAGAAPAVDDRAKARAEAYQSEVHSQFARKGWQIVREQPGRLVADHYLGFPSGAGTVLEALLDSNVSGVARVIVTFQPETATTTGCELKAKRYDYISNKKMDGRYTLTKPHDIHAPNILDELAGMIGKAHGQMLAKHPEYAAK